jgi:hypothetical protein
LEGSRDKKGRDEKDAGLFVHMDGHREFLLTIGRNDSEPPRESRLGCPMQMCALLIPQGMEPSDLSDVETPDLHPWGL